VDVKAFLRILVPLPPLPEQRAIAQVLRTVQRAREATEGVIAAARELKQSLMHHLFTYGSVPVDEAEWVELQETEIGTIPARWTVHRLGDVAERGSGSIQTGPFGSLLHASDYVERGNPVVMPRDLTSRGQITTDEIAFIGEEDYYRLERYHLQPGDVLLARRGEIGRRGLVTNREAGWVCGTGCLRIRPGRSMNPYFLVQAFDTRQLREWLTTNAVGTTMLNLSTRILKQMPLPCPSIEEQEQLARALGAVDAKIAAEETRRDALDGLFHSLLHHLMTGKIRTQGF
jgi:type I restriction enzyme S subunit